MKLIRKHNELNLLKESDDFDWIKGVDISDYLEPPYFKSMVDIYGLSPNDYEITLSKVFNQPITIKDKVIYNNENKIIYNENYRGDWEKKEYDDQGNEIYSEDSDGFWYKKEYDGQGNQTYYENAYGFWLKKEYDDQNKRIYFEDSNGNIIDNRHLNESDDFDWIRDVEPSDLPKPGTAWIMEINSEDSEEVQQRLFDAGFGWSHGGKKINETSGISAFVSYGGYDIKNNRFKMSIGDSYNSDYINHVIREVQPNELFIYEYKNGVSKLKNTNLNESDEFDWIRDVNPNISFHDVKGNEKYNVELTDDFYEALNLCFGGLEPHELMGYKRTTNVRVIWKGMMKHSDVYCYSGNNNEVISLHLAFYNDNGEDIAEPFWVTEEMVNLFPRVTDLNESDDFEWIRDVDITNHIEPPYFKNMKEYGLKPNEYESILSKIFNQPVKYKVTVQGYIVYDKQDNRIYSETSGGWVKREYDGQGNITYYEHSNGYWVKYEYDGQGNRIYYQNSNGEIEDNR